MNWIKNRLAADWRTLLTFSSVRLHLLAGFVALVYAAMPVLDPSIAAMLPAAEQAKAIGAYAIVGLLFRATKLKANG